MAAKLRIELSPRQLPGGRLADELGAISTTVIRSYSSKTRL